MISEILLINQTRLEPEKIARAAAVILSSGLVAFPTETVYGLGANALNETAVAGIFLDKGRLFEDPQIVNIGDENKIAAVVRQIPKTARRSEHF